MKTKPRLDYLFEADFNDGTTYYQGADDESLYHDKDKDGNGPSSYRDVLDRIQDVQRFHLIGNKTRYTVDLSDGHFEIDGAPFIVERPSIPLTDLKLFFLRYNNVESTAETTMQKNGLWSQLKEVGRSHYVDRYVIGFTAMAGAKEVNYSIAIMGDK